MKNYFILTSVFLGSSMLAIDGRISSHSDAHKRGNSPAGPVGKISIVIDKSDYELSVYDEKGWYATCLLYTSRCV